MNIGIPKYFTNLIPKREIGYNIRNGNRPFLIAELKVLEIHFAHILLRLVINSKSLEIFQSKLLAFIRPIQRSIYGVFNPQGLKFLTRLHLRLNHLNEQRFRHNFNDCISPLCSCSLEVENTLHFFLHCQHY